MMPLVNEQDHYSKLKLNHFIYRAYASMPAELEVRAKKYALN